MRPDGDVWEGAHPDTRGRFSEESMSTVSPRTRVLALAAVVPSLAGLAALTPHADASAPAAAAAAPRTTVTLEVTGCSSCTFELQQAIEGREKVWTSKAKKVSDGAVAWSVPTSRTRGMSVTVTAPWDGGIGAVPNLVFRYQGLQPGDAVTTADAASAKRAAGCFAGTDADTLTLPVTVDHARTRAVGGGRTHTPRAYTTTTQDFLKPMSKTYRGIIANQDAYWCRG